MNGAFSRVASRVPAASPAGVFRTHVVSVAPKRGLNAHFPRPHNPTPTFQLARGFISARANRNSYGEQKAKELNQKSVDLHERQVSHNRPTQRQADDRPWQRGQDPSSHPDATSVDPTRGDKTKGRLLTTPTRLLKLILPLPFHPDQAYINPESEAEKKYGDEKVEPLALLVHPQQPLSYLERLIQAEIPPILINDRERLPSIAFRAEADIEEPRNISGEKKNPDHVASYSGLGHEGPDREEANWVRWSGSTEVGDFIRDAARGREFAIDIEGHKGELRVAVPSFKDRTYYMRMRLRRASQSIDDMSKVKNECDMLAHKGAHRIAQGGFGALGVWWGIVYYVTFHTEMGWDLVEPVTYLAGLTTIMGGYLWFLTISRDLSYKAAMNLTVSRRQNALYQEKGFNLTKWERLVNEANALRTEIKMVAAEYDVDWDEMSDLRHEEVKQALDHEKDSKEEDDVVNKSSKKDDSQTTKAAEKEKS